MQHVLQQLQEISSLPTTSMESQSAVTIESEICDSKQTFPSREPSISFPSNKRSSFRVQARLTSGLEHQKKKQDKQMQQY